MFTDFTTSKRAVYATRHFLQNTGRYPYSSNGRVNLYPIFVESGVALAAQRGRVGIIVPSAISMDAYNAPLFSWLILGRRLVSLFDFDNTQGLFPDVDSRYRLCLLTLSGSGAPSEHFDFCFYAHTTAELKDRHRRIELSVDDIRAFSPNTLAPPMFLNARDTSLAKAAYTKCGVLADHAAGQNTWKMSIQRMLSLSDPGDMFRKLSELAPADSAGIPPGWSRLYAGKAVHQFQHRFATCHADDWRQVNQAQLLDPAFAVTTDYYVRSGEVAKRLAEKHPSEWLLVYRDVTNSTNERTVIAAAIPQTGCDTTCRNIYSPAEPRSLACFLASANSFAFDYFARQKVIGMHLGAGLFEQLPVLPPETYAQPRRWTSHSLPIEAWILPRVLELAYTAWDLEPFARDCRYEGPPFQWDEARRFLLRCELDAAFFHLYGISRDDADYILETFPIVKRKDMGDHVRYRTKETILEIYDALAEAQRTGTPYQTRLDPPPADPRVAHPPKPVQVPA